MAGSTYHLHLQRQHQVAAKSHAQPFPTVHHRPRPLPTTGPFTDPDKDAIPSAKLCF